MCDNRAAIIVLLKLHIVMCDGIRESPAGRVNGMCNCFCRCFHCLWYTSSKQHILNQCYVFFTLVHISAPVNTRKKFSVCIEYCVCITEVLGLPAAHRL